MRKLIRDIGLEIRGIKEAILALQGLSTASSGGGGDDMACGCNYWERQQLAIDYTMTAAQTTLILVNGKANWQIAIIGGRITSRDPVTVRFTYANGTGKLEGWTYLPEANYVLPPTSTGQPHFLLPAGEDLEFEVDLMGASSVYIGGFINFVVMPA